MGFPLGYLYYGGNMQNQNGGRKRKDVLCSFLLGIRLYVPELKPKFFFTDKDVRQISGIVTSLGINPSICLWHMKRAVRTKFWSLRKERKCTLSYRQFMLLQPLITEHYCLHPKFFYVESLDCSRQRAVAEMSSYCYKTRLERKTPKRRVTTSDRFDVQPAASVARR